MKLMTIIAQNQSCWGCVIRLQAWWHMQHSRNIILCIIIYGLYIYGLYIYVCIYVYIYIYIYGLSPGPISVLGRHIRLHTHVLHARALAKPFLAYARIGLFFKPIRALQLYTSEYEIRGLGQNTSRLHELEKLTSCSSTVEKDFFQQYYEFSVRVAFVNVAIWLNETRMKSTRTIYLAKRATRRRIIDNTALRLMDGPSPAKLLM